MFACGFCPYGHDILALYPNQKELLNVNELLNVKNQSFPGGSVVKDLADTAGDMGSIPGLGRSHMPQSNEARAPQPLSLCSRARDLQLLNLYPSTREAAAVRWPRAPTEE